MSGKYGTNFTESELILAACEGDKGEVDRLLSKMLDGELEGLRRGAQYLFMQVQIWQQAGGMDPDDI